MSELKHVFVYNKQQTIINFINLITLSPKLFLKTNDLALFFFYRVKLDLWYPKVRAKLSNVNILKIQCNLNHVMS